MHPSKVTNSSSLFAIDQLLRLVLITALAFWSYLLIQPFFGFLAWSIILAIALHPAYVWVNRRIGYPMVTATLFSLVGMVAIVGTLTVLTHSLVVTITNLTAEHVPGAPLLPRLPDSIAHLPWVGEAIRHAWESTSSNLGALLTEYSDVLIHSSKVLLGMLAHKTIELVVFILSIALSGYLLVKSDDIVIAIRAFMHRVTPRRGPALLVLMQETIKNISVGVIGVSLLQAVMFGLVLLLIGVPGVGFLTFLALLLSIAQLGLLLIAIPIAIWVFMSFSIAPACFYTFLLLITSLMDGLIKPFVFSHGLRTPMSLIFIGVIGGLILHGFIGIFIGPVILALFYDLFSAWLVEE